MPIYSTTAPTPHQRSRGANPLSNKGRPIRRGRRDRSAPIDPFDEQSELRRRQMQSAVDDWRPNELALLETLREKTQPRAVPGQNLQIVAALASKDEDRARKGIGLQNLRDVRREAVEVDEAALRAVLSAMKDRR